jgi:hypothetical protein
MATAEPSGAPPAPETGAAIVPTTRGGVLPFLPNWLTRNALIAIVVATLLLIWLSSGGKAEAAEGVDGDAGGDAADQDPAVLELVAAVNKP